MRNCASICISDELLDKVETLKIANIRNINVKSNNNNTAKMEDTNKQKTKKKHFFYLKDLTLMF